MTSYYLGIDTWNDCWMFGGLNQQEIDEICRQRNRWDYADGTDGRGRYAVQTVDLEIFSRDPYRMNRADEAEYTPL